MTLQPRFDQHLLGLDLPAGAWVVAVSGGPDSLALLELLLRSSSAPGARLHVAHADHGIHPESAAVAERVRAIASARGVPFHVTRLALGPGASETVAREARYRWLGRLAGELGAALILTAHHADDQVETILMRLLRGSGPAGLAGIAARRGPLVRPLLPFRRVELAEFVRGAGLSAWTDPANQDPRHLRSWLRTVLLPLLREQVPEVDRRLLQVGRLAALDRAAWDGLLVRWPGLDLRVERHAVSVAVAPLPGYDSGVLRGLLAALGRRLGLVIGPVRAARIERLLAKGRRGAVAELGSGSAAELAFDRLRLFRGGAHPWKGGVLAGISGGVEVGEWRLRWTHEPAPARLERNPATSWFVPGRYSVRPWQPGDRIRPLGGTGGRLVVRCMQDERIARSRRATWPVLVEDGVPVWVPGVCRSADRVPAPGAPALRIDAELR